MHHAGVAPAHRRTQRRAVAVVARLTSTSVANDVVTKVDVIHPPVLSVDLSSIIIVVDSRFIDCAIVTKIIRSLRRNKRNTVGWEWRREKGTYSHHTQTNTNTQSTRLPVNTGLPKFTNTPPPSEPIARLCKNVESDTNEEAWENMSAPPPTT